LLSSLVCIGAGFLVTPRKNKCTRNRALALHTQTAREKGRSFPSNTVAFGWETNKKKKMKADVKGGGGGGNDRTRRKSSI